MFYVATNRRDWEASEFYREGAKLAQAALDWAGEVSPSRMLEIGCGAGRMLVHFAPRFDRVDGIDIAPEMIETAKRANLPDNVHLALSSGTDLREFEDACFGFVFCQVVFQHIPDREVVASYLCEVARVLAPAGKAVMQFDTRPQRLLRTLVMKLPDPILPRQWRRFIRRYPVPREWLSAQLRATGLEVLDERNPGTDNHLVLCRVRPGG